MKSVRNVEEDCLRLVSECYHLPVITSNDENGGIVNPLVYSPHLSLPVVKPIVIDISSSGSIFSVIASKDDKPMIEFNGLTYSLQVDASNVHGKVLGDSWFGGVSWSFDNRYVAYVAMRKEEPQKSTFEKEHPFGSGTTKYDLKEDWGEKFDNINNLVIAVFDTLTGRINLINDDEKDEILTIGSPSFTTTPNSYRLTYTAWTKHPRQLGMIYCYHRPCSLYEVDLTAFLSSEVSVSSVVPPPRCITSSLPLARSARYSPDGRYVVFIGRDQVLLFAIFNCFLRSNRYL
jgi:hypothetical protein